jgi:4-amino-4-deoxy-L-arabinose transferase-like glycosyltransferase
MNYFSKNLDQKYWNILAISAIIIFLTTSILWIVKHPYAVNWDESEYINTSYLDFYAFKNRGIYGLVGSIFKNDIYRPPAYRLGILPMTLLIGSHPIGLRLISIGYFIPSLLLIYLTGKRLAGSSAGAIAVILLVLSPAIVTPIKNFGTEYILYLSISGMLYFIFKDWNSTNTHRINWVGFGLFLGLGILAKLSFGLVAIPIIMTTLILSWRKIIAEPTPSYLIKGTCLGVLIALPWWIINYRFAIEYAQGSSQFFRHSLGTSRLDVISRWIVEFLTSNYVIGLPLVIFSLGIILILVFKIVTRQRLEIDRPKQIAIWICLAGVFPLIFAQLSGLNQNMRLISPVLIPLALIVGIIAQSTRSTKNYWAMIIASLLFGIQITTAILPLEKGVAEQWNWDKLWQICIEHQIQSPRIVHLGNGSAFNPPVIIYPWISKNEPVQEKWLWRYEESKIDWNKINTDLKSSDIVVTAPGYIGDLGDKNNLDNQHNTELAQRLQVNPDFLKPIQLEMGESHSVKVLVFVRKAAQNNH